MIRRWIILNDGVQSGPSLEPEVVAQIVAGTIPPEALVSCGSGWITARELGERNGAAAAESVPAPAAAPAPAPALVAAAPAPAPALAAAAAAAAAVAGPGDEVMDAEVVEEFWEDDRAPQGEAWPAASPVIAQPHVAPEPHAAPQPAPFAPSPAVGPAMPPPLPSMRMAPVDLAGSPGVAPMPPPMLPPLPALPPLPSLRADAGAAGAMSPQAGESDGAAAVAAALLAKSTAAAGRDRVVLLGRRQSGKTLYLAMLYARLWRSASGMSARALTGDVHKQLMETVETLKRGEWPAATLESSHLEMEIEYHGRRHSVVMLDFAGEVFARAFVHERTEGPEARALLDHIDRAAAVLLLVDPSVTGGGAGDAAAVMEDDFGLVQAVQRIRGGAGGDRVPIALCLTKIDVNGQLVAGMGGAKELVRRLFPPLVRMLKQVTIFSVSAVQVAPGPDGRPRPRPDSKAVNLENPLKHCLRVIHQNEDDAARQRAADEAWVAQQLEMRRAKLRERRQTLWLVIGIGTLILAGVVVIIGVAIRANR